MDKQFEHDQSITYRELYSLGYGYQVTPSVALGVSARYREQLITDTQFLADPGTSEVRASGQLFWQRWNIDVGLNWKMDP